MLNVLKNSMLILLFVLTGSIFTPVNGQMVSIQECCAEHSIGGGGINEMPAIPLILFLSESCEITFGSTHLNTDLKSYYLLHFWSRNNKTRISISESSSRNLYFHPFSTLDKTKYYVFALRKIIV